MKLENTMLCEKKNIKPQNITYCIIPFMRNIQNKYIYIERMKLGGCLGLGRGQGRVNGEKLLKV